QLFEAAAFEFVSDEYFTLLLRQLVERKFQLIEKHAADVERFRPGPIVIARRQKIFDVQQFAAFILERRIAEGRFPSLALAEKIRDAVARDAKQPAGNVVNRHQQAIGLYQFVEDLLHDVLDIRRVGHTPADEIAQP